jgi:hypothetical protein
MMRLFEDYSDSIGTALEDLVLERLYQAMPSQNFSAHRLQESPHQVAVMELQGVLWSDWGNPEHILKPCARSGESPFFIGYTLREVTAAAGKSTSANLFRMRLCRTSSFRSALRTAE